MVEVVRMNARLTKTASDVTGVYVCAQGFDQAQTDTDAIE